MSLQHPTPDVSTLEVYMNAMLLSDCPMQALTALQWYLPLSSRASSEDTLLGMDTTADATENGEELELFANQDQEQGTSGASGINDGSSGVSVPSVNTNGARGQGLGLTSMGLKQPQLRPDPLTLFSAFVPAAMEINRQRVLAAENEGTGGEGHAAEMISARCLGYAMKAIWRLSVDEFHAITHQSGQDGDGDLDHDSSSDADVGSSDDQTTATATPQVPSSQQQNRALNKGAKSEAILYLLRYAEEANDLSAGLVVTAIAACRELTDWQSAYQIYNTAKLAAKEERFFDVSATAPNPRKSNSEYATGGTPGTPSSERMMPLLQGLSLEKRKGKRGNKLPRPSSLAAIEAAEAAAAATSSNSGVGADAVAVVPPPMIPIQIINNADTPVNLVPTARNVSGLQGGQGPARRAVGLPSIVYGQAVVTMAKGGAESQTFQVLTTLCYLFLSAPSSHFTIIVITLRNSYLIIACGHAFL